MKTEEIINSLELQIKDCKNSLNEKSWGMQYGILISKAEGVEIVELLKEMQESRKRHIQMNSRVGHIAEVLARRGVEGTVIVVAEDGAYLNELQERRVEIKKHEATFVIENTLRDIPDVKVLDHSDLSNHKHFRAGGSKNKSRRAW